MTYTKIIIISILLSILLINDIIFIKNMIISQYFCKLYMIKKMNNSGQNKLI